MNHADIVIIGGGAAGLMCAALLEKSNKRVVIIERNEKVAKKLAITGKGRCNLTNDTDTQGLLNAVTKNQKFLFGAFSNFSSKDTCKFFEDLGVSLKVERGNRVFPVSDRSRDIIDALIKKINQNGVELNTARVKRLIAQNDKIIAVEFEDGEKLYCDNCIVATGGKSYPVTGSSGDGYKFAKSLGINVIEPIPSLVPLNVHEGYAAAMQGLSLKNVAVSVQNVLNSKVVFNEVGEMLFTHFGLTGPLILSASAHLKDLESGKYKIFVDLKPGLDYKKLSDRLLRDFSDNSNKDYSNALDALLPKKMIPTIVKLSRIPARKKVNQITAEERDYLCNLLKALPFTVTSFRPIEEAIVTSGGIDTKEINPKTMASKKFNNLFFAGEVIDVDAYTGGFNLQIAFSTAALVAKHLNLEEN